MRLVTAVLTAVLLHAARGEHCWEYTDENLTPFPIACIQKTSSGDACTTTGTRLSTARRCLPAHLARCTMHRARTTPATLDGG